MRVRFFECSILFCLSVGKDEECTSGAASLLNISNFGAVHSQKEILMDKQNLRILFMGTPDFAVASLKALVEGGYCVVGVVTMPDKPMGRHGSVLQASPVKQYAAAQGLRVLQPERLSDSAFVDKLRKLDADLQIVVAFRMLPRVVWEMPRLGTFNLHASLLPQYRGAAPINWAVIHGDKETGVTTFFLRHEIDTGRIILQRRVPIAETDDAGTVHDRLMAIGAALVVETVDRIIDHDGTVILMLQFDNLGQFGQITLHGEHAIDHNQLDSLLWNAFQHAFQVFHVVVFVVQLFGKRQSPPVYNAGMVTVVANNIVASSNHHCQHTLVNRETRRET